MWQKHERAATNLAISALIFVIMLFYPIITHSLPIYISDSSSDSLPSVRLEIGQLTHSLDSEQKLLIEEIVSIISVIRTIRTQQSNSSLALAPTTQELSTNVELLCRKLEESTIQPRPEATPQSENADPASTPSIARGPVSPSSQPSNNTQRRRRIKETEEEFLHPEFDLNNERQQIEIDADVLRDNCHTMIDNLTLLTQLLRVDPADLVQYDSALSEVADKFSTNSESAD